MTTRLLTRAGLLSFGAALALALASCASTAGSAGAPTENDTTVFSDIPAARIAQVLSPGWNLGNQLEGVKIVTTAATGTSITYPSETGYSATKITKELLDNVKAAGFRFVRIPVSYFANVDDANGHKINPEWLARIKQVVDWCIADKLYCMINIHGDGYYTIRNAWLLCNEPDQKPILEKYTAIWKQLAETFKGYDESLIFESMNEEFDGKYNGPNPTAYENINAYNEAFVKTVRETGGNNAKRWLLVAGWNTNIDQTADGFGTKGNFRLPKDNHLMVSLHYYDPWGFCGGENGNATQWGLLADRPDKANGSEVSMAKQFNKVRDVFTSKGIPVVIGEWGSIDKSVDDPDSNTYRAYFAQKLCENALRVGAVPVYWDNAWNGKYGFALFNRGEKADADGNVVPGSVSVSQQGIIDAIMGVYRPIEKQASEADISFDEKKVAVLPGETVSLYPNVVNGGISEPLRWVSSDETVAVVSNGLVVGAGSGTAKITATLTNGKSASCEVTVSLAGGIQAKVYLFEGAGWSSVKSAPIIIKPGVEKSYEAKFNASKLVLTNIAALYLKDVEIEENHAPNSTIDACAITIDSISINGISIPLQRNEKLQAVNEKKQFDLPMINEWNPGLEMIAGFAPSGNRDITTVVKGLKLDNDTNEVYVKFRVLLTAAGGKIVEVEKPKLDPAKTYHAFLGLQTADSWVFRNSYGAGTYGGKTEQFKNGLFDTENAVSPDGHVPGTIVDAEVTKADIDAGKTFTVTLKDFSLDDSKVKATAFNIVMISTDIPFGLVKVTSAKLFLDGKQVNLNIDGDKELFGVDTDNGNLLINFINIWNSSLKTFGYRMPTKEIKMQFTCTIEK